MNRATVLLPLLASVAVLGACQTSSGPAADSSSASSAAGLAPARVPSDAQSAPAGLPGTLSVLTFEPGKAITLLRHTQTTSFGTAGHGDVLAVSSRDGRHVALISSSDPELGAPGDLVVVDAGGQRHVLAHKVTWGGGVAPVWTPDGRAVVLRGVRYEASGGGHASAGLTGNAAYLAYSVDGAMLAYAATDTSVVVGPVGGGSRRVVDISNFPECSDYACPFAVQAVSNDGNYVALGDGNTDLGTVTDAHIVLDTRSRKAVDLTAFGDVQHIWFTASGGAIIHTTHDLRVVDTAWHVTGTFPAPGNGTLLYTA
ncbi:hypothetical protein [Dactylosporangium sp. CA-139066]|uniref:hypothetical protein n=1 Tax=Dactylosporangium sp. CA-139066 TaxID=3239930 RepID=UPI003D8CE1A3